MRWLRRHRRIAVDVSVIPGSLRLRDVSVCGLRAQSNTSLRLDDTIDVQVPVGGKTLTLTGRVVRARRTGLDELPYEYGIELAALSSEVHEQLLRFMDEHGIDEEPTSAVDANQIELLRERIAELEQQLVAEHQADSEPAPPLATETPTQPAEGTPDSPRNGQPEVATTQYDRQRFLRLLELGQPLIRLVEDPAAGLVDPHQQLVARAFTDSFDLATLKKELRGTMGREDLIAALYACYEQDLIDFA